MIESDCFLIMLFFNFQLKYFASHLFFFLLHHFLVWNVFSQIFISDDPLSLILQTNVSALYSRWKSLSLEKNKSYTRSKQMDCVCLNRYLPIHTYSAMQWGGKDYGWQNFKLYIKIMSILIKNLYTLANNKRALPATLTEWWQNLCDK